MAPPKKVYDQNYIHSMITITENDCWEWNGSRDKDGYGQTNSRLGTDARAHRLSFKLFKGPITCDVVRHTCDNSPCCNPDHLLQGSWADNLEDAIKRGRVDPKANSDHANSFQRIPDEVRKAVVELSNKGERRVRIAETFKISVQSIANIIHEQTQPN